MFQGLLSPKLIKRGEFRQVRGHCHLSRLVGMGASLLAPPDPAISEEMGSKDPQQPPALS